MIVHYETDIFIELIKNRFIDNAAIDEMENMSMKSSLPGWFLKIQQKISPPPPISSYHENMPGWSNHARLKPSFIPLVLLNSFECLPQTYPTRQQETAKLNRKYSLTERWATSFSNHVAQTQDTNTHINTQLVSFLTSSSMCAILPLSDIAVLISPSDCL